ncbi:MAG TPA: hypothetical protein VM142_01685 [Acidimicrobiales bacterium]|nr:hypothetical protein [Acidimicrobiales bacterium]
MSTEYKVSWRRTAWSAGTWPRRKLFRRWSAAVAWAKKLERDQDRYGPVEIEIHQRTCTAWAPTVWNVDLSDFCEDEGGPG